MFDIRCMTNLLFSYQFKCCFIQMLTKCLLATQQLELNSIYVEYRAEHAFPLFGSNFCVFVVVFHWCFC